MGLIYLRYYSDVCMMYVCRSMYVKGEGVGNFPDIMALWHIRIHTSEPPSRENEEFKVGGDHGRTGGLGGWVGCRDFPRNFRESWGVTGNFNIITAK